MTAPPTTSSASLKPDAAIDALIVAALALVAGLGIWLTSPPAEPKARAHSAVSSVHGASLTATNYGPVSADQMPYRAGTSVPRARAEENPAVMPLIPTAPAFITLLGDVHNDAFFWRSKHANPNSFYGGTFKPDNILNTASGALLQLKREPGPKERFTLAELKTMQNYGYGRYEVVMSPAAGKGSVSAFFTYTGPYEGAPHDEVDIEFLGLDTTRIHLNYFKNGQRGTPATFDLPFDAAEGLHHYAFEWTPEKIRWYVEGELIHETARGDARIPKTPGKLMLSVWTGIPDMRDWHGPPEFGSSTESLVACVSFTPMGESSRACSDFYLTDNPFRLNLGARQGGALYASAEAR